MRQIGLPDRDITNARRAEQRLRAMLQQYPDSSLKELAEARLSEVQDNLGMHNLVVGNFYYQQSVKFNKGGLKGAQSRYREIVTKYPNFSFMDEVLYKLALLISWKRKLIRPRDTTSRLSVIIQIASMLKKRKSSLRLIGATIPEANPDRMTVLPPEKLSFFQNFKNEFLGLYPLDD